VSPHESVNATIDGAEIVVTYGRPSMRGRAIFGALVPYGRVWCPGADEATTLDSSRVLHIGTLTVPAGPHTIWMLPTADTWTLVVSKEASGFHTRYNESADLGRVELRKQELPDGILVVVSAGSVERRERFTPDTSYEEADPLPPVRAPHEGVFCLQWLAAFAAA